MFSWSNNNNNSSTSRTNSTYPGRRGAAATSIEGSIRPPSSSHQHHTRKQHLTSYIEDPTLQKSTRKVSSDDTTYDTVFQTTSGDTLILRVNIPLGSSFASCVPVMTLAGVVVRHPWVSATSLAMRVMGYSPIQSEKAWKDSNLLLGSAVHDVVKHFQLNPPNIIEITDKGLQSIQSNTNRSTTGSNSNNRNHKMQTTTRTPPRSGNSVSTDGSSFHNDDDAPPSYNIVAESTAAPDVPMPRVPLKFTEIDNMSREQLDELLGGDESVFRAFVHRLKSYNEIFAIGSFRLNENVVLAKENLEQGTEWKMLRNEVKDLHDTLKTKLDVYTKLEDEQNTICAPPDIQSTLRKLHKAKKEAFEESEQLAEEWVEDSGGNVDDFCQRFLEQRKVHHIRAAKMEILQHN